MAGYTRQSSFADGDTITAALFNDEYNQLVNAFSNTTGHSHDGTAASGPVIGLIGDAGETSPNNKVLIDTTNNYIEFYVEVSSSPVQQLYIADGAIVPVTDSDVDLGTSSLYFKDSYIDTVTTTGNVSVGGNLTVTGNATISGNLTFGDADTDSINLAAEIDSNVIPNTDNTYDLGSSTKEWKDIYIDGTAYLDAINFNGTAITSTAAELNILDGVTSTATELNIVDGDTSATSTTLADADRVVVNDNGTMVQVALTDFETYFESALDTLSNVTTVGALNSGSITSGFGSIDNGSSAITTTGTITYGSLSDGTITITAFADEDDMSSNSATLVPTQQSVKAYVDSQVTAQDLDFQGDSGGALSIDLDSETLTIAGGTGIDTTGATNTLTVAIDSTVATLTGSQTLTNKTLTSPVISSISNTGTLTLPTSTDTLVGRATTDTLTNKTLTSPVINGSVSGTAILDNDAFDNASATTLATSESIKAYVDAQILTEDTLAELNDTNITSPAGGALLFYEATTAQWIDNVVSGDITMTSGGVATIAAGSVENSMLAGSIANDKLANSTIGIGGIDFSLGSSDATPALDLTDATNYPTSSLTGTITNAQLAGSIANSKLANSSITVADSGGVNSTAIALGGTITFAGTSNEIEVAESSGTITYGLPNDVTIGNDLTVTGDLTVNGTTTTVNSTTVTVDDPIFTLGGDSAPASDDNKDRGIEFRWHNGSAAKVGFFGYDDSASVFTFIPDATNTSEVFSGSAGNVAFGNIAGTLTTAAQTNITSVGTLSSATISGDLTVDTSTLKVDSTNNRVGIGNASPDVSLDLGSNTDSIHVPVGTTAQRPSSPAAGYFRYNSTTGGFEGYTTEWGAIAGSGGDSGGSSSSFTRDEFTGNGSTTAFTLSKSIAANNEDRLIIFNEGVFQRQDSYTLSGTTLTFDTAPANGNKIVAYIMEVGVVGANPTVATMTGDGSDTTLDLTVTPSHENATFVTIDGVFQHKDTYSVSGSTLTFSAAPPNGSAVECTTFTTTTLTNVAIVQDTDQDTKIQVEESSDEDKIRFDTGGTERMVLDNSGNLLFSSNANDGRLVFTKPLAAADYTPIKIQYSGSWGSYTDQLAGIDVTDGTGTVGKFGITYNGSVGKFAVSNLYSGGYGGSGEVFSVLGNGNVGIGTTSPSSQLHLSAATPSIQFTDTDNNADAYIQGTDGNLRFFADDSQEASSSMITFAIDGTQRIRMASGGQLGINQNSAENHGRLVVKPSVVQETCFQFNNNADARRWFYIVDGYYGYQGVEQIYANGGVNRYFNNATGGTVGSIVVNASSTAFNTSSDYRLKDNPQPLTGSGDFIDGLQPKTWTWNHGDGGTGVGFIAHEAADVGLGLCVTGEKDAESLDKVWNEETEEYEEQTTPTYQQLDYSSGELIGNIVAELQALRTRVATLETELDAAEARITTLENE